MYVFSFRNKLNKILMQTYVDFILSCQLGSVDLKNMYLGTIKATSTLPFSLKGL